MVKRKKKLKLKKKVKKMLLFSVIVIVLLIFGIKFVIGKYQEYKYHQTIEYKLLQKDYTMDDIKLLNDNFDDEYLNNLINEDYNESLIKLLKEKYFIRKNLDRYLNYQIKNKKMSLQEIVQLVNVNRDSDYYENIIDTDLSKDPVFLVNKYYHLPSDYVPQNLIKVSASYGYQGNIVRSDALEAFIDMAEAAKDEDIVLIINSSYRSYDDQEEIWQYRKAVNGQSKADQYAARAGHSEHQSGLAIDIAQFNSKEEDFENTPAFNWLSNHAHEYGFILRYPKDKENITGYAYESWHYRYVGVEAATKIYNENITFDEYYAYYIDK